MSGSVGSLDIDYFVEVEKEGLAELSTKLFAHKTDRIRLKETVILRGERSRGLIKTRVVLEDEARAVMWIAWRLCRDKLWRVPSRS